MPAGRGRGDRERVVIASANPGKLREFASLLRPSGREAIAQSEFGVESVEESGGTFIENAILKARAASAVSGLAAIADDSGLMVDALGGAPGVRSARLAGEGASDGENIRALLSLMEGIEQERRRATFVCVVVYLRDARDPLPILGQGSWQGRILDSPRGRGGFGYDPIFFVPEYGASVAELLPDMKNASSHRAKAFEALVGALDAPRPPAGRGVPPLR